MRTERGDVMVVERLTSLLQICEPSTESAPSWDEIDAEFSSIIAPIHYRLCSGETEPVEAANTFSILLRAHLERFEEPKSATNGNKQLIHRTRRIEKVTEKLRNLKKSLGKSRERNSSSFMHAIRAHNKLLKASRSYDQRKDLRRQERAFRENPWSFAKKACDGPRYNVVPSFNELVATNYFATILDRNNSNYSGLPNWVKEVTPSPDPKHMSPFDLSPITPGIVKRTLMKRSSNSSPGEDGITYHHLKKLPSTHHFLATLFSKILLEKPKVPEVWCEARIKLFFKGGDDKNPANFRPIALTSAIGKLYHKIIAHRLERFVMDNEIVDASLQKGFLTGINGTVEHIFAVSAIVQNALQNGLPFAMTFLDLQNAFGSISHHLILDVLVHCRLPEQITAYITDLYSKLMAYVKTKKWSTGQLKIGRGVFQGDTLSPLIFLIAFNPIIQLAQSLDTCGFHLRLPKSQCDSPKSNSVHICSLE